MISKRIARWPIEVAVNTLSGNLCTINDTMFDLELSISSNNVVREDLEVGVSVFYYTDKSHKFELSTLSKFKFANPINEEATLHYIFNCILTAIADFNVEISKYCVEQPFQYPKPEFEQLKPHILKIKNLNLPFN